MQATARGIFNVIKAGILADAVVSCVYQTDTFDAVRTTLQADVKHSLYGTDSTYTFSVLVDSSKLTTDVKTTERITITGAALGTTGKSPMRVLGSSVDGVSALTRLDIGSEYA